MQDDLEFLRRRGIEVIVSLLESTMNLPEYHEAGFETHHFPVEDFTAPRIDQVAESCDLIAEALRREKRVLVHCNAGIGRTGSILACTLVHRGESPADAIRQVRELRPYSLETSSQAEIVHEYHRLRRARQP